MQGEACKDEIDTGKTPRSVSWRKVRLRKVFVNVGFSKKFKN